MSHNCIRRHVQHQDIFVSIGVNTLDALPKDSQLLNFIHPETDMDGPPETQSPNPSAWYNSHRETQSVQNKVI